MGQVNITVNGRDYQIACGDGEEEHIEQLAAYINHHASELVGQAGQVDAVVLFEAPNETLVFVVDLIAIS